MDFKLNEEHRAIKAAVREFCEREVDSMRMAEILRKNNSVRTIEEIRRNFPYDVEEKAYNVGLHQIGIPTKYGGPGPDIGRNMAYTIAKQEAGYSAGLAAWFIVPSGGGHMAVNPYYMPEEREQFFQLKLSGYSKEHFAYSNTEPGGYGGGGGDDIHIPYDDGGSNI